MSKLYRSALVMLAACGTLGVSAAKAVVIDTFTRADDTTNVAQSLGVGDYGFGLLERGLATSGSAGTITSGTAQIDNGKLRLTGNTPGATVNNGIGGVYIPGYQAPDVTISARIQFDNRDASGNVLTDPGSNIMTNYFAFTLRSAAAINITGNITASEIGLLDIDIYANGDIQVREGKTVGAAVSAITPASGYFSNYFTQSNTITRTKLTSSAALQRMLSVGGQPLDLPTASDGTGTGNGFIDGNESFVFKAVLAGNSLSTYINDVQVGQYTTANTAGAGGNLIGLSKNRRAAADTAAVADILVDDLNISPVPEPTSIAALGGLSILGLARKRRTN